ncbi:hypothetical protein P167DRAFT_24563 [Morchella conica CCBAS932]|uniref:Secreted protein n=1 Tax=Morchella conica CCBAS932 TaxID=1392247 RepID=A0A3N4K903_9PEZI|nr:hypothetical protein P167DRAFT_24563 [Morchella conica CCBAS932]
MLHVIRSLFLLLSFLLQFNHTIQSSSVSHKDVAYFNTYTICRCRHFIFTKSLSERSDTQSIPTARGGMHKSTPTYGRSKKKRKENTSTSTRNTSATHSNLTPPSQRPSTHSPKRPFVLQPPSLRDRTE